MNIDITGLTVAVQGGTHPILEATLDALRANGAIIFEARTDTLPDILLVSCLTLPGAAAADPTAALAPAREFAKTMVERGHGRIVFLVSALAGVPMRRHPDLSVAMAGILAGVRVLAMQSGPHVLVNAVGFGAIEDVSGDVAQLSHTPLARAGTVEEAVAAVLFFCDPLNSYTTGQMLSVDGGWSTGYGRNF